MRWPIPIADYVAMKPSIQAAADSLGMSRPAVSLWLKYGRQIFVLPNEIGQMTWYEVKPGRNGPA